MTTKTVPIDQLTAGDIVIAVNGKPRPFPYTVKRVISHDITVKGKRYLTTRVDYEHGGVIPPCDPQTALATVWEDPTASAVAFAAQLEAETGVSVDGVPLTASDFERLSAD